MRMSNLYCAWKDRVPLLTIGIGGAGEGANQGADKAGAIGTTRWVTEPFTTWTANLVPNGATDMIRRAIKFAFGPPSGPVTLGGGTGGDDQVQAPIYKIDPATMRYKTRAQPDLIQKAAQWLIEAQNPVFVVGAEVGVEGAQGRDVGAGGEAFRSSDGDVA